LRQLQDSSIAPRIARIRSTLYGSLAYTGRGHATDRAIAFGLLGWAPSDLDVDTAERQLAELHQTRVVRPPGLPALVFDPAVDIVFDYGPPLPGHANGLIFSALDDTGAILKSETYYSIGGGFVVTEAERASQKPADHSSRTAWPFPFEN